MKISSDYVVTTAFGWIYGYPLNLDPVNHPGQGYHNGEDWYMPVGTPLVVNNVQIGISGATGNVTGAHCHVGKWIEGTSYNPNGYAWALANPVVTDIGYDTTNGNYVGLRDASGVRWVYLHMLERSTNVKVGDYLNNLPKFTQGEQNMPTIATEDMVDSLAHAYLNDSVANNPGLQAYIGQPVESVIATFNTAPQRANYLKGIESLSTTVNEQNQTITTLNQDLQSTTLTSEQKQQALQEALDKLTAQNSSLTTTHDQLVETVQPVVTLPKSKLTKATSTNILVKLVALILPNKK